ncbi:MAG: phosphotransferase [Telmatospirillum sp.]|nr:phosphotransferase [Telmatospirillum sp.]
MAPDELTSVVTKLWREAFGLPERPDLTPCPVSGNNRVFLAHSQDRRAIVKWYFRGKSGDRDRQDCEWRFLAYAEKTGTEQAPRPLGRDIGAGVTLMEYLAGEKPTPGEVGEAEVMSAADFLQQLNSREHSCSADLSEAAEACFCSNRHFAVVQQRLARLTFEPNSDVEEQAAKLVAEMNRFWNDLRPSITIALQDLGLAPNDELAISERAISPADFGFHNAIRGPSGRIGFFDFEYGGWDDPAKTIADFSLQPALPVPAKLRPIFVSRALELWPQDRTLERRTEIMMPLFALKWCCIMLNPFSRLLGSPRRFADPMMDVEEQKQQQLGKARAAFSRLAATGSSAQAFQDESPAEASVSN